MLGSGGGREGFHKVFCKHFTLHIICNILESSPHKTEDSTMAKGYSPEEAAALIAEYEASGKPITKFCKDRGHKPAYQTLKDMLIEAGKYPASGKTDKPTPVQKEAPAAAIPNTPEAIKAQIEKLQNAYKASLQSKVDSLRADIERMQEELVAAELELEELS